MKIKGNIFNDGLSVFMVFAVIISLGLFKAFGDSLPNISSAWLIFSFGGAAILYLRARNFYNAQLEELSSGQEAVTNPAENLVKNISYTIDRQVEALNHIVDLSKEDISIVKKVHQATSDQRLNLYLQPIVSLDESQTQFFEAFSRMIDEDGQLLRPSDYLEAVEKANHIGFIDNMIFLRSVQAVRKLETQGQKTKIFCNISPATLYDQHFFTLFTQYLDCMESQADKLVFEFTYPAMTLVDTTIAKNLGEISERGFCFSVDHVNRLDLDISALKRLHVKYVKIPAQLLASLSLTEGKMAKFVELKNKMDKHQINIIAEKIENQIQDDAVKALGVHYGQGNFYGFPNPAKFYQDAESLKKAS